MTWESGVPEDIMDILQTLTPKLAYRHDSSAHVAAPFEKAADRDTSAGRSLKGHGTAAEAIASRSVAMPTLAVAGAGHARSLRFDCPG